MWVSSPLSMAFAQTFLAPEARTVASLLTPPTNNLADVGTILQPRRLHRWGMSTFLRHERLLYRVSSETQTYFNTRVKQLKVESDKRKADEAKGKGKEE